MAGLKLVFSLLSICLISCTASPSDLPNETPLAQHRLDKNFLGLAQILYYKEGLLCSGIHIKPWIVLTIADCVFGRDLKRLVVVVTKNGSWVNPTQVEVESVTIHDKYRRGRPKYNFALLNIYGKMEWKVYEFQFTSHFVTYDELNKKETDLITDKWLLNDEDFYMEWKWFIIFKNDSLCGTCEYDNCYCGTYWKGNPEYFKVDVGAPLYYNERKDNEKLILGLDTGTAQAEARVFQEVYSIKEWVATFIHFHPVPPEAKF